jgi:hypothetical protein
MIKEINVEGLPYNRAEIKALLLDGSCKVELFNVDEEGQEYGERDTLVSFSSPWPFELSEEELNELNK